MISYILPYYTITYRILFIIQNFLTFDTDFVHPQNPSRGASSGEMLMRAFPRSYSIWINNQALSMPMDILDSIFTSADLMTLFYVKAAQHFWIPQYTPFTTFLRVPSEKVSITASDYFPSMKLHAFVTT